MWSVPPGCLVLGMIYTWDSFVFSCSMNLREVKERWRTCREYRDEEDSFLSPVLLKKVKGEESERRGEREKRRKGKGIRNGG